MELLNTKEHARTNYIYLLVAGIVLIAFNLRPAITSLGPLVGMIQEDVGLAHWSAGLLMSLPLIVFAFMSPLVPRIAARLTNERTLLIGLTFLFVGISIRSIPTPLLLFTGTFLAGLGIAIGNVLLPAVVKERFPNKFGLMTSVYSTSMGLIASLASGISIPLAIDWNLGWQGAQMVWALPVIAAIVLWGFLLKNNREGTRRNLQKQTSPSNQMWRSSLAWQIAIFMGFQSFSFYVTVSWLTEILHSHGISLETAGWLLSFTQLVGLPASFIIPVLAGRFRSQVWLSLILGIFAVIGYSGLLFGSTYSILIVSIIFIGVALGGSFPLALTYIGLRSRNGKQAAELSGMAQSTGYVLAAIGPLFIGYLYDMTQSWTVPLILLIVVSVFLTVFGMFSGRDRYVQ